MNKHVDNNAKRAKARNALVEAMDPNTKLDDATRSIHVSSCLSAYKDTLRDNELEEMVKEKLATRGIKNISNTWISSLTKVDISDAFQSSDEIANDWKMLDAQFKKCATSSNKRKTMTNDSLPNSSSGHASTSFHSLETENLRKVHTVKNPSSRKTLGMRKMQRSVSSKFISPVLPREDQEEKPEQEEDEVDERLKHINKRMIKTIKAEILNVNFALSWDDIAGLQLAKKSIRESVVWPLQRPDIFKGLRQPPKGILLYGPPGTGKTLIARCIASQSKSTFFNISTSSLTSKWVGDGEKMVRALFAVARCHQPAVIFIDEIDSLLSQRSDMEHESSRRIKTEFLVQLDGASTENEERLLIIGATNRPQELDQAMRRRFVKRLYIPLPDEEGRLQMVKKLMKQECNILVDDDYREIAKITEGFSGADMKTLCSDACLGPIRDIDGTDKIETMDASEVRPVSMDDFRKSLTSVRSSVSSEDLQAYSLWDQTYGTGL